jgi:hypothetical protein
VLRTVVATAVATTAPCAVVAIQLAKHSNSKRDYSNTSCLPFGVDTSGFLNDIGCGKAPVAGLPNGIYECFEQPVEVRDGEVRSIQTGKLAGSSLKMCDSVANMKKLMERSLLQAVTLTNVGDIGTGKEKDALLSEAATKQAVRMATLVPAQVLNLKNLGEISVGKDADLVILNPKNFEVVYTLVGGDIAYQRT